MPSVRHRKSALVAVLLQCIPLLGVPSCVAGGLGRPPVADVIPIGFFLVASLCWGLGYPYLGRWERFGHATFLLLYVVAVGVAGWMGNMTTAYSSPTPGRLNGVLLFLAGSMIVAVLVLAIDAWRLARGIQTPGPPRHS
jgi:hypothetical protein